VLDGGPHHLLEKDNIEGERVADYKVTRLSAVSCAKTAEPIEMPFGLWTRMGPRKHALGGVHTDTTWRMPLNRSCGAAVRLVVKITLTNCYCLPDDNVNNFTVVRMTITGGKEERPAVS